MPQPPTSVPTLSAAGGPSVSAAPLPQLHLQLNTTKREIRLLEITNDGDEALNCQLEIVSLDEHPVYTALSYFWGDPTITENIVVNGLAVPVTVNLASALRRVKQHWRDIYPGREALSFRLWADAICINQADYDERSEQVRLMRSVYSSAESVFSWLAAEDGEIPYAFYILSCIYPVLDPDNLTCDLEWMRKFPSLCRQDDRRADPCQNRAWSALEFLCCLPYWTRTWIYQEVLLAKSVFFLCPSAWIGEVELLASSYLLGMISLDQRLVFKKPDFIDTCPWISLVVNGMVSWYAIHPLSMARILRDSHPSAETGMAPLDRRVRFKISHFAFRLKATDPRDNLYGLLALTDVNILPDYRKTIGDVYRDYFTVFVAEYQQHYPLECLDFLSYAGIGNFSYPLDIPSWAPNFAELAVTSWNTIRREPAVRNFDALDSFTAEHVVIADRALLAPGVRVQSIERIHNSLKDITTNLPAIYKAFYGRDTRHITEYTWARVVFCTLHREKYCNLDLASLFLLLGHLCNCFCPDLEPTLDNSPEIIIEAFLDALGVSNDSGSLFHRFMNTFFPESINLYSDFRNLLQCVGILEAGYSIQMALAGGRVRSQKDLNVSWRLVEAGGSYIGLAPPGTRVGDVVCLLEVP